MSRGKDKDDEVRISVKMRRQLREDAKRNTERGELSEEVRDLYRRIAYGTAGSEQQTEIERARAELQEVRDRIDELRQRRRKIDAEIETQETRATRLEERIESLEEQSNTFGTTVETLEGVLLDGGRIFPERVDDALNADAVIQELKDRNPDVPEYAFRLASPNEPNDWRDVNEDTP
jgi:chromosome segregation ATPase